MACGPVGLPITGSQLKARACGPGPRRAGKVFCWCWNRKPKGHSPEGALPRPGSLSCLRENPQNTFRPVCSGSAHLSRTFLGNVEIIWLADETLRGTVINHRNCSLTLTGSLLNGTRVV